MHKKRIVLGVVDGVENLLGRKLPVHRMKDGAHHRDCEKILQVPVAVIVHHSHSFAFFYPEFFQDIGKLTDSFVERPVVVALDIFVYYFVARSDS